MYLLTSSASLTRDPEQMKVPTDAASTNIKPHGNHFTHFLKEFWEWENCVKQGYHALVLYIAELHLVEKQWEQNVNTARNKGDFPKGHQTVTQQPTEILQCFLPYLPVLSPEWLWPSDILSHFEYWDFATSYWYHLLHLILDGVLLKKKNKNIISSRSIHIVINSKTSFFFMATQYSVVYMYHNFFTH